MRATPAAASAATAAEVCPCVCCPHAGMTRCSPEEGAVAWCSPEEGAVVDGLALELARRITDTRSQSLLQPADLTDIMWALAAVGHRWAGGAQGGSRWVLAARWAADLGGGGEEGGRGGKGGVPDWSGDSPCRKVVWCQQRT